MNINITSDFSVLQVAGLVGNSHVRFFPNQSYSRKNCSFLAEVENDESYHLLTLLWESRWSQDQRTNGPVNAHVISTSIFSRSRAANSVVCDLIWLNFELI